MIGHMVLYRPKPGLAAADREALVTAIEQALTEIPGIRGSRIGERLTLGRRYDLQNTQDFPFAAFIEFDDEDHLRAYLDHPAHQALGRLFYQTAEAALAFDFVLRDAKEVRGVLKGEG